ncbi:MAG: methylenetetrahydrofolate--tRNA-(uracil(54)-C(5))-methyltransferase (FADH(2)-oxidizing) TrmFO [Longimicrobiales bacterium]|nr:methylenetetrahydrofolate--tRNA-(uracil(54)-C(5))-methyltransferase (FADH(2)-oxidizing) TrmFO [Longimicrobiales bacterium]
MARVTVVGGGLAGCEAAWQLAERGHRVALVEMRPVKHTEAHQTDDLAELVCTNSFKSEDTGNAHGLLKAEMRRLGSILLSCADTSRVPAGTALAVDRELFSARMTRAMESHPGITLQRREVTALPAGPAVIATGPLTSDPLTDEIRALLGDDGLAFYDSIAPIVEGDSVDMDVAWLASRWGKGAGADYLNCPMTEVQYEAFIDALLEADVYPGHDWENIPYFEGCLPVEVMAERGRETLRYGPMKPIGLPDPRTGTVPHAVVQLRREDREGQMWNVVGFQTRLRTGEQRRVFRMIPGLGTAEFLRMGSIHRNTYLNFPGRLTAWGAPRPDAADPDRPEPDPSSVRPLIFAGQLTGVEGYTESAASGILAGLNLHRIVSGLEPVVPPATTMIGGLYRYLRQADPDDFQPMNSNFGLLEPLPERVKKKRERRERMAERALAHQLAWMAEHAIEGVESLEARV